MARPLLLACAAGVLLLGGCTTDRYYDNGAYAADGYRPWWGGYYGAPYGWGYGGPPYDHEHDRYVAISPNGRFIQPENKVVCDQLTEVCYKKGNIDATETRQYFGRGASHRADNIRDRLQDNNSFLPRPNVACSRDNEACYRTNTGQADRQATRRFFGGQAARQQDRRWGPLP